MSQHDSGGNNVADRGLDADFESEHLGVKLAMHGCVSLRCERIGESVVQRSRYVWTKGRILGHFVRGLNQTLRSDTLSVENPMPEIYQPVLP